MALQILAFLKPPVLALLLVFPISYAGPYKPRACRITGRGSEYEGTINSTVNGTACQRWDSQEPNPHGFTEAYYFPDSSMEDVANNCRNPDWHRTGPWCYSTVDGEGKQLCDVPRCPSDFPECKYSQSGIEYLGALSETKSGQACLSWNGVPEDSNFCRNPDGKEDGPWCFVDGDNWEYCDVPFCKPSSYCRTTTLGQEYSGHTAWTSSDRPCQRWDKQAPHSHDFTDPGLFPDETLEDAGNYCRNPDGQDTGPWCYTIDPDVRAESCGIPLCQDCKLTEEGHQYAGALSETTSGLSCQRWDAQEPHVHVFTDPNRYPDASLESANNYCRNPDGRPGGPWCYTMNPDVEWAYCDIPVCSEPSARPVRKIRHVVHIGVDGLRPSCMLDAPGGLPNIWGRIATQGAYTLNGRTVIQTWSGPGWSANLLGMGVESSGVTGNGWGPPWMGVEEDITPVTGKNIPWPTVFQTIKAQDDSIQTGAFYDWDWIRYLANHGVPGSVDKEWYCGFPSSIMCERKMMKELPTYIEQALTSTESSYTFIYFEQLDATGHTLYWCSPFYKKDLSWVDNHVGTILDAIESAGMANDTLVMLTTDHGGHEFGHGSHADVDLIIPVMFKGPGVKKGYEFTTEVRNYDLVPTALHQMGLKSSKWMKGNVLHEAFEDE